MHSPERYTDTSEAPLEPLTSATAALDGMRSRAKNWRLYDDFSMQSSYLIMVDISNDQHYYSM